MNLSKEDYTTLLIKVGRQIGSGADGKVYNLIGEPHKVIKISSLYKRSHQYKFNPNIFNYLLENNVSIFPKLFRFKKISEDNYYVNYYYIMEKCFPITDDEYKVFHSIISHEDFNKIKTFSNKKNKKTLAGLSKGLDFDAKEVKLFLRGIEGQPLKHKDLHPRNIMKDINGCFKLIDLDRMEFNYETT